ncbi:FUSC family protein [Plasticicumulans acidivorans]|uniref:Putative membrane protein YccC n=1 Tax=Plasticicumulans acidivorans TaxID=886464 RepID=A0A317MU80_9GAMM|nr:FUSC family protein [Plasticicumulans acidivorans]PWV61238.1 putative membrane protein YccC [Plasticicumulans acidivorans]
MTACSVRCPWPRAGAVLGAGTAAVWRLAGRGARGLRHWPAALNPSPVYRHALRTVFGALLALWLAYWFELSTPFSAATTVLLVAQPMHGMVLAKSLYRLGGTLIGALMALLLTAAFAQHPEMFILSFGLWMAVCNFASTLLRSFRSYGAILAGYTVALIALPAYGHPQDIFALTVARVSTVGLGIVCSAVVASLTSVRSAERSLSTALANTCTALAAYARQALTTCDAEALREPRRKLAATISGFDALLEFAALESSVGVAELSRALRSTAVAMFGALTAAAAAQEALARLPAAQRAALAGTLDEFGAVLQSLAAGVVPGPQLEVQEAQLAACAARLESAFVADDLARLSVLDRLRELADELALCLDGLAALSGQRPLRRSVRLAHHRDYGWAAINATRSALVVWLAGALWFVSAWPMGELMLAMIVPNIGLLSLRDHPARDAVDFVIGSSLASLAAYLYLIAVLPQISGFALLALALGIPLLLAVVASMRPATAFIGVGFYVFFITLLAPTNPMVYAPETLLNSALATVGGAIITAVVYRLVLPVGSRRHVRALVAAIHDDLYLLIRERSLDAAPHWESRMHERLVQLGARLRAEGSLRERLMRSGFAALRIGREVLRLRVALRDDEAARLASAPAVAALRELPQAPRRAVRACHEAAERLLALAADAGDDGRTRLRSAAAFAEIGILLGRHRLFFSLLTKS